MRLLHIANLNFEEELQNSPFQHPLFLQLQFLPLLYMGKEDALYVSCKPASSYLKGLEALGIYQGQLIFSEEDCFDPSYQLESWGASSFLEKFALKKGLSYSIPSIDLVRKIHAKNYYLPPSLPITLLDNREDALAWIFSSPFPKVLKTPLSLSGRGKLLLWEKPSPFDPKIHSFLEKAFYPLRGERWLERIYDFSTQWHIGKDLYRNTLKNREYAKEAPRILGSVSDAEAAKLKKLSDAGSSKFCGCPTQAETNSSEYPGITYLGSTRLINTPNGSYQKTILGDPSYLSFLEEHQKIAYPLLETIRKEGFWGNLGLDAFVYLENGKEKLYPICEVNARKTMGFAALAMQKRHFEGKPLTFSYEKGSSCLLPSSLGKYTFSRNIKVFHTG